MVASYCCNFRLHFSFMLRRTVRPHFTPMVRVQFQVNLYEVYCEQSSTGAFVLRVLRFPLQILIPFSFRKIAHTKIRTYPGSQNSWSLLEVMGASGRGSRAGYLFPTDFEK
jgi:hypothetical protein